MSDTDLELLNRYATHQSEDAFSELVHRHVALVHSAALRQVRSRNSRKRSPSPSSWISPGGSTDRSRHPSARLASSGDSSHRRGCHSSGIRRQTREQIAVELNSMNAATADWTRIEPLLDEALESSAKRTAPAIPPSLLRAPSVSRSGVCLGTTDDAAQSGSNALLRLRDFLGRHGVAVSSGVLATLLSKQVVEATPCTWSLPFERRSGHSPRPWPYLPCLHSRPGSTFIPPFPLFTIPGVALLAVATVLVVRTWTPRWTRTPERGGEPGASRRGEQPNRGERPTTPGDADREPNPLELLLGVQKARRGIQAGTTEYEGLRSAVLHAPIRRPTRIQLTHLRPNPNPQ